MRQETLVERVAQWPRNSDTWLRAPLGTTVPGLLASAGLNCFLRQTGKEQSCDGQGFLGLTCMYTHTQPPHWVRWPQGPAGQAGLAQVSEGHGTSGLPSLREMLLANICFLSLAMLDEKPRLWGDKDVRMKRDTCPPRPLSAPKGQIHDRRALCGC